MLPFLLCQFQHMTEVITSESLWRLAYTHNTPLYHIDILMKIYVLGYQVQISPILIYYSYICGWEWGS
jgi:hypothetical protein